MDIISIYNPLGLDKKGLERELFGFSFFNPFEFKIKLADLIKILSFLDIADITNLFLVSKKFRLLAVHYRDQYIISRLSLYEKIFRRENSIWFNIGIFHTISLQKYFYMCNIYDKAKEFPFLRCLNEKDLYRLTFYFLSHGHYEELKKLSKVHPKQLQKCMINLLSTSIGNLPLVLTELDDIFKKISANPDLMLKGAVILMAEYGQISLIANLIEIKKIKQEFAEEVICINNKPEFFEIFLEHVENVNYIKLMEFCILKNKIDMINYLERFIPHYWDGNYNSALERRSVYGLSYLIQNGKKLSDDVFYALYMKKDEALIIEIIRFMKLEAEKVLEFLRYLLKIMIKGGMQRFMRFLQNIAKIYKIEDINVKCMEYACIDRNINVIIYYLENAIIEDKIILKLICEKDYNTALKHFFKITKLKERIIPSFVLRECYEKAKGNCKREWDLSFM